MSLKPRVPAFTGGPIWIAFDEAVGDRWRRETALIRFSRAIHEIVLSFRVDNLSLCKVAVVGTCDAAEAWSRRTNTSCAAPSGNQLAYERRERLYNSA